jgi:hypothetical protein
MLPMGVLYFTLAVTGVSVSLALIVAPVLETIRALGGIDPDSVLGRGGMNIQPEWLGSPGGLLLCFVTGVILLTVTLHASRGIARGHAALAKTMLVLP